MNRRRQAVKVLRLLATHQGKTMLARLGRGRPFQTLVATVLSARVRDEVTEQVLPEFFRRWPDAARLSCARPGELEQTIRRIGLYRIKSRRLIDIARALVEKHGGRVPRDFDELTALPGVGRKTAGCVVVYAFGGQALPVDTHVHRISNRLGWTRTASPEQTERELTKLLPRRWWAQVNDLLVQHGKTVCLPLKPRCPFCPACALCPAAKK